MKEILPWILFLLIFQVQAWEKKYIPIHQPSMKEVEEKTEDFPTVWAKPMPHIVTYSFDWKSGPRQLRRHLINEFRVKNRPGNFRIAFDPKDFKQKVTILQLKIDILFTSIFFKQITIDDIMSHFHYIVRK